MRTRLLARNPIDRKTRDFRFTGADVTIGSEPGNTLQLRHETVSRRHAIIASLGSSHEVRDLKSTNGTFVNELRIQRPTALRNGDHIRFGAVSFVYAGEVAKRSRVGLVPMIEAFLILLVLGFGLTEYLLNWQSIDRSVGASTHREIATPNMTVQTRSQPGRRTTSNVEPVRAISAARTSTPIIPEPSREVWLQRINFYRAMAGLNAVRNDAALSGGCLNHARYLLENYAAIIKGGGILGSAGHDEEPDKKGYSSDGADCAGEGNVAYGCGRSVTGVGAIDSWMGTPFHRLGILDPELNSAAFGGFENEGCWASALRLPSHPKFGPYVHPVEFPPDGSTIALAWPGGEWPNPLDGCPGYSEPVGLPITIQLGEGFFPNLVRHSLTESGVAMEHCAYDAKGYSTSDQYMQEYARQVLHSSSAIVLIPRHPLTAGKTYAVSVTANGQTYKWSFMTAVSASRS